MWAWTEDSRKEESRDSLSSLLPIDLKAEKIAVPYSVTCQQPGMESFKILAALCLQGVSFTDSKNINSNNLLEPLPSPF